MKSRDLINAILNARPTQRLIEDSAGYKLGYIMEMFAEIVDHHPDVAAELRDRLSRLQEKK
jgi:hypothetical protein